MCQYYFLRVALQVASQPQNWCLLLDDAESHGNSLQCTPHAYIIVNQHCERALADGTFLLMLSLHELNLFSCDHAITFSSIAAW
jgi:hypothetical protein